MDTSLFMSFSSHKYLYQGLELTLDSKLLCRFCDELILIFCEVCVLMRFLQSKNMQPGLFETLRHSRTHKLSPQSNELVQSCQESEADELHILSE